LCVDCVYVYKHETGIFTPKPHRDNVLKLTDPGLFCHDDAYKEASSFGKKSK